VTYIGTMWPDEWRAAATTGLNHDYMVPWQAFATQDGYIVVATREEIFWRNLCEVTASPRFAAIRVLRPTPCG